MHPIEATLYYSAALIPVALGLHPVSLLIFSCFSFIPCFVCGTLACLPLKKFFFYFNIDQHPSITICFVFRCTHWQWSLTVRWEPGLAMTASSGLAAETTSICFTTRFSPCCLTHIFAKTSVWLMTGCRIRFVVFIQPWNPQNESAFCQY